MNSESNIKSLTVILISIIIIFSSSGCFTTQNKNNNNNNNPSKEDIVIGVGNPAYSFYPWHTSYIGWHLLNKKKSLGIGTCWFYQRDTSYLVSGNTSNNTNNSFQKGI